MVYPGLWLWLWGGDWVWRACGEKAVHGASGARGTLHAHPRRGSECEGGSIDSNEGETEGG